MTDVAVRPAHASSWRMAIFVTFALNGLAAGTWVSRTPSVRDHLGISVTQVGFLILGVSVGSVIGLILAGHLVHWLGARRTILLFLSGCGLGLIVIGLGASVVGSFGLAILGYALFGFASGITDVAMNVDGAEVERAVSRAIMPWFHASWSLGTVIGAGVGSAAAFAKVDPAIHLGIVGLLLVAGAIVVVRWIPRERLDAHGAEEVKPGFRERMSAWVEPRTLLIGLVALGWAFTEGSANDWLALAMIDGRGVDNGQGALLFGVFTAAMTVGRITGVPLLDRFGRVATLRGAAIAAVVGLGIVILVPSVPIAVIGIVLWGLGASLGFPVGMSSAADDPARAAARVSVVSTVGYCAFLVGPPVIGFVGDHIGLLNALFITMGLIVLAAFAVPATREPARRAPRLSK